MDPEHLLDISFSSVVVVTGVLTCLAYGFKLPSVFFSYWIPVVTTHLPLISTIPDITAMPVKSFQNQAGQTISDD